MAKKSLRYVVFAKRKSDGTYEGGKHLSPAVGFTGTPNNNDAKDYGDDKMQEVIKETTGAALSVELNNDDLEIFTMLLGHTLDETGQHIIYNVDDEAPYVGVGACGKSGSKWRVKFYTNVMFAEPTDENTTRAESPHFGHITLEGDAIPDDDGVWKIEKEFDTFALAKAWLDTKTGIGTAGGGD